jgi:hypothetical protein
VDESFTPPGDDVEHWLPVPNWAGFYEVSDKSRVRSLDRTVGGRGGSRRRITGRILRPVPDHSGYPSVKMEGDGRRESVAVHMLVQRAFGLVTLVGTVPDAGEPERWRPVVDYGGLYEVSDLGRVRSLHGGKGKGKRGGLLRPMVAGRTNIHLRVILHEDGRRKTRLVHQLVMEAFVGPRPAGQEVRHGPGGVLDNRLVNLCYGSRRENMADKVRDGTLIYGEDIKNSRLTEQIVIECRRRYAAGETITVLGAEFGVNQGTIGEAVTGDTWARLPGAVPRGSKAYHKKGAEHHAAKLTPEIVREMRRRGAAGEAQHVIAAGFGVSQSTVWRAIHGKNWVDGHSGAPTGES